MEKYFAAFDWISINLNLHRLSIAVMLQCPVYVQLVIYSSQVVTCLVDRTAVIPVSDFNFAQWKIIPFLTAMQLSGVLETQAHTSVVPRTYHAIVWKGGQ